MGSAWTWIALALTGATTLVGCSDSAGRSSRTPPPPTPTAPPAPASEPGVRVLLPADPMPRGHYGMDVAIDGDTLAVSAVLDARSPRPDCGRAPCLPGVVYVYDLAAPSATPVRLSASDQKPDAYFGGSLALSGNLLAIGAPRGSSEAQTGGEVYVFERTGSSWSQIAVLAGAPPRSRLGTAVAIAGDVIVAGAPTENENTGAVYVYARDGGAFTQIVRLAPGPARAELGSRLALTDDVLVIGGAREDVTTPGGGFYQAGTVYLVPRRGNVFGEPVALRAPDQARTGGFGSSVALARDLLVVGDVEDRTGGVMAGAVHVYHREGAVVRHVTRLLARPAHPCETFGQSIALSGPTMFVAAPRRAASSDCPPIPGPVRIHRFTRAGDTWTEGAPISTELHQPRDLGWSISHSGSRLVASAIEVGPRESGAAYVFDLRGR